MEIIINLALSSIVRSNWVSGIAPPVCTNLNYQSGGCVYNNLYPTAIAPNPAPNSSYYNVPSWYTSINPTSINNASGTQMKIKEVKYYSVRKSGGCSNTNTFTITSTSFNWSNPPISTPTPYVYSDINMNINFSGTVSVPSSTTGILRATNSIRVPSGTSLYVPPGSSLYLDVNPCY